MGINLASLNGACVGMRLSCGSSLCGRLISKSSHHEQLDIDPIVEDAILSGDPLEEAITRYAGKNLQDIDKYKAYHINPDQITLIRSIPM